MLEVKVIVQLLATKHSVMLLKIIELRCMPSIGMSLLIDDDIEVDLLNDERTKTHITIATQSPEGVDAIIRNTTYYSDITDDGLVSQTQYYINSGWELITDSCGLMREGDIDAPMPSVTVGYKGFEELD